MLVRLPAATAIQLPEGLDETLHLLGFSLDADVGLELPQRFVQLHAGEVHLIHHAAEARRERRDGTTWKTEKDEAPLEMLVGQHLWICRRRNGWEKPADLLVVAGIRAIQTGPCCLPLATTAKKPISPLAIAQSRKSRR